MEEVMKTLRRLGKLLTIIWKYLFYFIVSGWNNLLPLIPITNINVIINESCKHATLATNQSNAKICEQC